MKTKSVEEQVKEIKEKLVEHTTEDDDAILISMELSNFDNGIPVVCPDCGREYYDFECTVEAIDGEVIVTNGRFIE